MESITCPQVMENQKSLGLKTVKRTQELGKMKSPHFITLLNS